MQRSNAEKAIKESLPLFENCTGAVLAVSGGPDSMAMLHLFIKERDRGNLPFPILCATLDHGLRPESAAEAEGVRGFCARHGVPFETERVDIREELPKGESTENYARIRRYDFFEKIKIRYGYSHTVTAHNADDNFETLMLNIIRGCGTDGLCGISPLRKDNNTVRPLLSLTKEELTAYCDREGIPYYIDSSNADTVYRRNFIRNRITPLFRELNPSLAEGVLRLCKTVEADCDLLDSESEKAYKRALSEKGLSLTELKRLHPAILSRVLRRYVKEIAGVVPTFSDTEELTELVTEGKTSDKRSVAGKDFILTYTHLTLSGGEEATFEPLVPAEEMALPKGKLRFTKGEGYSGQRHCFKVIDLGSAVVRPREEGDYMRTPQGSGKLVKKLYIDKKIPRELRASLPLLVLDGSIVWAAGIGTAKEFIPAKGDTYIKVEYIPY